MMEAVSKTSVLRQMKYILLSRCAHIVNVGEHPGLYTELDGTSDDILALRLEVRLDSIKLRPNSTESLV